MSVVLKRLNALLSSCVWGVRFGFSTSPVLMVVTVALTVCVALIPGAQVMLVGNITEAIDDADRSQAMAWAVAAGVAVAGYMGARQVMFELQQLTHADMTAEAHGRINSTLASLTPGEMSDPAVSSAMRAARESVQSGKVAMQATSALSAVCSIITCAYLAVALARIDLASALLVLLSLLPLTVAAIVYSNVDAKLWPEVSEAGGRGTYPCPRAGNLRRQVCRGHVGEWQAVRREGS